MHPSKGVVLGGGCAVVLSWRPGSTGSTGRGDLVQVVVEDSAPRGA
jgi:hypothetical protein